MKTIINLDKVKNVTLEWNKIKFIFSANEYTELTVGKWEEEAEKIFSDIHKYMERNNMNIFVTK